MKKLIPFLLILLVLTGCASSMEEDATVMTISLPENPSTGYVWIWGQMGSGHLELISDEYVPDAVPEGTAGSGGTHTFTFAATAPGHVTLSFSCVRPWEEGTAAADSTIYSVTIYDDLTLSYL